MNLLQRLDYLKQLNGDTNGSLSKKANIPYSTIDNLYKRGWEKIQLNTLQTIASHYHVTLDYLVGLDDDMQEDMVKQNLLNIYEELSDDGKLMLLAQAEFFRDRERSSKKEKESVG